MKNVCLLGVIMFFAVPSRADFWGGDLPLLAEIVMNTLNTLNELEKQSTLLQEEMAGIKDKIYRVETIANVVQPATWNEWKNPSEALRRLQTIYYTLPKNIRLPSPMPSQQRYHER